MVPLGLFILRPGAGSPASRVMDLAGRAQPICALSLCIGLVMPVGPGAFAMSVPWFAVTALLGLSGLMRFVRPGRTLDLVEIARSAAPIMLTVGGAWACIAATKWHPLGFSRTIVLLTAVHFHYAG